MFIIPAFTAILAGLALAVVPQVPDSKSSPDQAAVRTGILELEKGWNAGDADRFAAPFAVDADYVVVDGQHIQSRKVIADGHRRIFDTVYKGSRNKATIESVRFVRPDLAISVVSWELRYGPDLSREAAARSSMTWLKSGGKWEIVSFQNTPIQQRPVSG